MAFGTSNPRLFALTDLRGVKRIDGGQPWDYPSHLEPRIVNGWYRTESAVPADFKGKPVRLYFARLYGMKVTLWVDSRQVEHRDLPRWLWYDYHHEQEFDLTPFVRSGETQTLTLRLFKEPDWGGPYAGAFLYSPKDTARKLDGLK